MSTINKENSKNKEPRKPYYVDFAEQVISMLEAGTAPWQKPWKGGELYSPHNDASGTTYKGINRIMLSHISEQYFDGDPRFMTLHQANEQGYRVKKGEHSQTVVFWQFTAEKDRLDADGKPVLGDNGKPEKDNVRLERPMVTFHRVFNVQQLHQDEKPYPALDTSAIRHAWNPDEKAEAILAASKAQITHKTSNRAYYSPTRDEIVLPKIEQFPDQASYYGTALHELGHWTGHESRLGRDVQGPFGSPEYAREELRAEIATWMLGQDVGIAHDPDQHAAYVQSWIKALQENPYEIVAAARDAEHIKEYVMGLERQQELTEEKEAAKDVVKDVDKDVVKDAVKDVANEAARAPQAEKNLSTGNTYLAVPYDDRNEAKELGARWAPAKKLWFVPPGADIEPLKKWLPEQEQNRPLAMNSGQSPQEEFAAALKEAGLDLRGELPTMDGKLYRVPLLDRPDGRDGAYSGYLDGHPAGFIQNYVTGEKSNWKSDSGHTLSEDQLNTLREDAAKRQEAREAERRAEQDQVAEFCAGVVAERADAANSHPYLARKGVQAHGIKQSPDGDKLIVPLRNVEGAIRSVQVINADGEKRFEKGGQKYGCFHLIGDESQLSQEVLLAEGYATGASLYESTGKAVAVCFDAGNLEPVAKAVRDKYPQAEMTICADNDVRNSINVGLEKAQKTAEAVKGRVVMPVFSPQDQARGLTDFNDLHKLQGEKAVSEALALRPELARSQKAQPAEKSQGMSR